MLAAALTAPASADPLGLTTSAPLVSAGTTVPALCSGTNPFAITAGLNGNPAPCAIAPRSFVIEAIYLQNASRVGGTALAAYPLVSLRAGILPRLQFTFDAPSEIAQSRPGGGGAFPITHLGYGLTYTVAETDRVATALVTEVLPPDSRFTAANAQSRYSFGLASDVSITSKWTLGATGAATSSSRAGFGLLLPSLDVTAGYAPNAHTQFVTGLGTRIVSRRAVSQSFTDVGVNQILDKKLFFMVGLGTTFNAVNSTKPHYLATGFTYRP
jgi:hypothetical protein